MSAVHLEAWVSAEFRPFPKVGRWFRDVTISEKIDGTNAAVVVTRGAVEGAVRVDLPGLPGSVWAQSRNRIITPDDDNFGFAKWVQQHAEGLALLGEGYHFGEWFGKGIQRGYGLESKRFALFNAGRWTADPNAAEDVELIPPVPGLTVVPVLYRGPLDPQGVNRVAPTLSPIHEALRRLQFSGSLAAPGFRDPEGIMVFHEALRTYAKSTLKGDAHKG